jgi:hypothetical protein
MEQQAAKRTPIVQNGMRLWGRYSVLFDAHSAWLRLATRAIKGSSEFGTE